MFSISSAAYTIGVTDAIKARYVLNDTNVRPQAERAAAVPACMLDVTTRACLSAFQSDVPICTRCRAP